jgi:hypothetical protein
MQLKRLISTSSHQETGSLEVDEPERVKGNSADGEEATRMYKKKLKTPITGT